jgi:iron complex outermembrane receptor protein
MRRTCARLVNLYFITTVYATFVLGDISAAQTAQSAISTNAESSELAEVVVTAQRKAQNIQEVPISITAISPATIDSLHLDTIDQIGVITTGLVFETGYSWPQTYIRGIGAVLPNPGLENPVALYADGSYVARGNGTLFDLLDMSSVQVLKGPQGTLYGHNASGGAILLNTADPTHVSEGSATLEGGNYDHVLGQVVTNVPVSETFALRFAVQYKHDSGYIDDVATGNHIYGDEGYDIRAKAKWDPSDALSAILTVENIHEIMESAADAKNASQAPLCVACSLGATEPAGFYQISDDFEKPFTTESTNVNVRLQYDAGPLKYESISDMRYMRTTASADSDQSSLPLFAYDELDIGGNTFDENLQVSSSFTGIANFLAGVQYIHDSAINSADLYGAALGVPYVPYPAVPNFPNNTQNVITKSYAAFAEMYIKPIDKLTITLGGRYTKDIRDINSEETPLAVSIFNPGGPTNYAQSYSDHKLTPRAVVAYDFGATNVYASYTQGFKAGGFTTIAFAPQANTIQPETINSYEVGAKFLSNDRRVSLNVDAFRYDYSDVQVAVVNVTTGGQLVTNAASAVGKGAEADLQFQALDWLRVSGGGAYLDARYTNYPNGLVYLIARNAQGEPLGYVTSTENLTGDPLTRSPKWSGYLSSDARASLSDGFVGRLSGVLHYTTGYDFYPDAGGESQADRQHPYALVNLSGGVGPRSGGYEVGFYIDNLTDRKYYTLIATGAFGVATNAAPPITYGLRLKMKF